MKIRLAVKEDFEVLDSMLVRTPEFDGNDTATCLECLTDYLNQDPTYTFICAEEEGKVAGFACYGKDSIADKLVEIYWIAVSPDYRRKGVGRLLISHIEDEARRDKIRMIVTETESDRLYSNTRRFYEACGYAQKARIEDFYEEGDDKVIYAKRMENPEEEKQKERDEKDMPAETIEKPSQIPSRFRFEKDEITEVAKKFPMRISPYYFNLIEYEGDPIWKQCIPDKLELEDFGLEDPLNEEGDSPVPGLTHRYPDRVLLLVSNKCATYCRFCTRKRKVGDPFKTITMEQILKGISYIRRNPQIRDVILSGGDPLMLSDRFLERILKELRSISHVQIIRIGTRVPCTLPQRITEELCSMLSKYHPVYVNTHFNHPREITPESQKACTLLANAGIPLGCQTVLLKGVNDNPQVLRELMQKLVEIRVKPYYVYQCDLARGNEHFRTPISTGIEMIENLRGHTSGLCIPQFVIDAPGGGGKIPLQPNYIVKTTKRKIVLRNYRGRVFEYPEPIFLAVRNKKNGLGLEQSEENISSTSKLE
ncbi:MAG: KamA family radical SAM protein [Candidatus Altiarchaeota archaeon]